MNFGSNLKKFQNFKNSDYPTKFLQNSDEMLLIRELHFCVFDLNFSRFQESLILKDNRIRKTWWSLLGSLEFRHPRWLFLRPFELIFRDAELLNETARHIFTPDENMDLVPNVRISKWKLYIFDLERHVDFAQLS